jgi:hypothetical protein
MRTRLSEEEKPSSHSLHLSSASIGPIQAVLPEACEDLANVIVELSGISDEARQPYTQDA